MLAENGDVFVIVNVNWFVPGSKEQLTVAVARFPFELPTIEIVLA